MDTQKKVQKTFSTNNWYYPTVSQRWRKS